MEYATGAGSGDSHGGLTANRLRSFLSSFNYQPIFMPLRYFDWRQVLAEKKKEAWGHISVVKETSTIFIDILFIWLLLLLNIHLITSLSCFAGTV